MKPRSPFPAMVAAELRGQVRSGLTALYLGMPLVWIIIARLLPPAARPLTVLIGTYSDPVMMGQIFTGAFLARERDQGLLEALAVTPLGAGGWLAARCLIIGLQGTFGGVLLAVGAGVPTQYGILLPALFLASMTSALIGLILARPFRDILSYFVVGGVASAALSLPILGGLVRPSFVWLTLGPAWPGWAALSSALGVSRTPVAPSAGVHIAAMGCWSLLLFFIARRLFHRGFFRRPGSRPASPPSTSGEPA